MGGEGGIHALSPWEIKRPMRGGFATEATAAGLCGVDEMVEMAQQEEDKNA